VQPYNPALTFLGNTGLNGTVFTQNSDTCSDFMDMLRRLISCRIIITVVPVTPQIVESCPLTKLNGGLSRLHSAHEDAVFWLTNYGSWHAYEEKLTSPLCCTQSRFGDRSFDVAGPKLWNHLPAQLHWPDIKLSLNNYLKTLLSCGCGGLVTVVFTQCYPRMIFSVDGLIVICVQYCIPSPLLSIILPRGSVRVQE